MNQADIQNELNQLVTRQSEMTTEAQAAQEALENAQNALVEGKGSVETATQAQSKVSALSGALATLAGRIQQTRERLAAQKATDHEATLRARLKAIVTERQQALAKFTEAQESASAFLAEAVKVMNENDFAWSRLTNEHNRICAELPAHSAAQIMPQNMPYPTAEYAPAVALGLQIYTSKVYRADVQRRQEEREQARTQRPPLRLSETAQEEAAA